MKKEKPFLGIEENNLHLFMSKCCECDLSIEPLCKICCGCCGKEVGNNKNYKRKDEWKK